MSSDFKSIRHWRGSQHQAFEELCYQLRDDAPNGASLIKTGNPDGGLEWYITWRNGTQWGWQAKFTFDIDTLLNLMERSLKTVVEKRPKCRRIIFCIPFDLPDAPGDGQRKSARRKFDDRKTSWRQRIPGAERVRIELWSEGELLERLVRHPHQRGMERFFWGQEVFSLDWCRRRLDATLEAAGGRYSPELHIDLPVAFALEGLASSDSYWQRFCSLRRDVLSAARKVETSDYTGIGVTKKVQKLIGVLKEWRKRTPDRLEPPNRLNRNLLQDLTRDCWDATRTAYPYEPESERQKTRGTKRQIRFRERRSILDHRLWKLASALKKFDELLRSDATEAAARGMLLLEGEAGQGKTHLFCDAARRAIERGQPAIMLLGGRLSGRRVWAEIAEQLGLGQTGSEEVIGAMQAAAEASNAPFLLLIDALNEARDPKSWQEELPALLAEIAGNPWIALGVSVRSSFLRIVLPTDGVSNIAAVDHPGFSQRETEAIEGFFHEYGLDLPQVPQIMPEFTNPLFLKLYCEGLKGMERAAPPAGADHVSQVFNRYMQWKAKRVANRLELDPDRHFIDLAVNAFCQTLVEENRDSLAYDRAVEIIDGLAPHLKRWPDTLFAQLISEGVLTKDLAWRPDKEEPLLVVRFTYQRLADYNVASTLLEPLNRDPRRLRGALAQGEPLWRQVRTAPIGWIEALSVLAPEQFGIELLDAACWKLDHDARQRWDRAFVRSIAARRPSAFTQLSRALLSEVQRRSNIGDLVLEAMLTVAPVPEHALNANFLHDALKRRPMPERDLLWSIPTYHAFDDAWEFGGTLNRLIRWAAQGPHPGCPGEVIELVAVTIAWTFTSPNRRMRDYATKALVRLLSSYLQALPPLIQRFDGVDDPYVIERLAVVAHGTVLCGGNSNPEMAVATAGELKRLVFSEGQSPNFITRDAVRGVHEWCLYHRLIAVHAYREMLPPYGSQPPEKPRTEDELKRMYDQEIIPGERAKDPYGQIFSSIFWWGDFGRYVVESKLSNFSSHLISSNRSQNSEDTARCRRARYPVAEGLCWVFERVLSLGWAPSAFYEFDQRHTRFDISRTEHKAERFGKKYQWIAFRELVARIADNFYMMENFDGPPTIWEGPWQFFGRDIDPTLPPPRCEHNDDGQFDLKPTFVLGNSSWWRPSNPICSRDDLPSDLDWVMREDNLPEFEPLVQCADEMGTRWVVLRAYHDWQERAKDHEVPPHTRPHMWSHIYSWIVRSRDLADLVAYLNRHPLRGRWMPEGVESVNAAYLGELPWASAAGEYLDSWRPVPPPGRSEESLDIEVCPTWSEYHWEGNGLDCSIDEGVRACFPSSVLIEAGDLVWRPGSREWRRAPDGATVAQFVDWSGGRGNSHSALLVREDWLKRTLEKSGYSVVFGWLGQKWLLAGTGVMTEPSGWMEFDAIASLSSGRWDFGKPRTKFRRPVRK